MISARDIYRKALSLVGAYGSGQSASAEDIAVCDEAFIPLIAELSANNDAYIVINANRETGDLADELLIPLAKLLANEIAPEYGAASDENIRQLMLSRLRRLKLQRDMLVVTFNATTDAVAWPYHNMSTGQTVRFSNTGGALPTGLQEDKPYYIVKESRDAFKIAESYGFAKIGETINLTDAGTGVTMGVKTFEPVAVSYL